ncbi:hypothetical protein [Nitrosopumilus sp.]|uniref:hypothetical protein n=1 Tax=Nitrosopumilus sp. TaxID=2024843 RepID=UPI00247BA3C7|nr:hypothetical protein [Nitrosopumilus sp.]MCV0431725.1 hypothetical protein [Nitrosopumilus sp.]
MASILLLAIGIAVTVALIGSVLIQFLTPITDSALSPLEKNCQQIANEGYRIHATYPDSHPDELPTDDFKRLIYLDELWITECVNVLPAESVFSIVNNVERDFSHGE